MIGGNLRKVAHAATSSPGTWSSRRISSGTWTMTSSGTTPQVTMIDQKIQGQKVVEAPEPHVAPVIDIMEALKRTLEIKKKPEIL